jgi:hypothetical protein
VLQLAIVVTARVATERAAADQSCPDDNDDNTPATVRTDDVDDSRSCARPDRARARRVGFRQPRRVGMAPR